MAPPQLDSTETNPLDPNDQMVRLPMSPDEANKWKKRIASAIEVQQKLEPWQEAALKSYAPHAGGNESPGEPGKLKVRTNRIFTIVERKLADLFYQKPDVSVTPTPLLDAIPQGAQMSASHAAIINEKLGLDGINVKKLAQKVIFDYELLCLGVSKIYYHAYTKNVTRPQMQVGLDGNPLVDETGQPMPMLEPDGTTPIMETVPVPIKTECRWEHFSPKQFLIPADFRSTEFDKAPWLGMRFRMPLRSARRIWTAIPDDFQSEGTSASDHGETAQHFDENPHGETAPSLEEVTGTELYCRSMLFRDEMPHPDHLTKIVFIDGIHEPVEHRDDPDQEFDRELRMTPQSRMGYPYHPLVIRVFTDSAYVMSDAAIALPLVEELDHSRDMRARQRQINLLKGYYNTATLPEAEAQKFARAPQGGLIGLPPEAFVDPQGPIKWLDTKPIPADENITDRLIDEDLAQTFGIDADAAGVTTSQDQTATEAGIRQTNRNIRTGNEQGFVADWFVAGVTKLSSLVAKYVTVEEATQIVGAEAAQLWDQWRKAIPVRLAFTMTPDSSLRNDTALDRLQSQQLYSYLANDPMANRAYLLNRLLTKFHIDPSKGTQPPPEAKPDPPKASLTFKGEDLSPLMPQSPIVLDLLMKLGMEIDPNALTMAREIGVEFAAREIVKQAANTAAKQSEPDAQTAHGGKVAPMPTLDKHLSEQTGAMQNTGEVNGQLPTVN